MTQFDVPTRDGQTYQHERDGERLDAQHARVWGAMRDGCWRTPEALEALTGDNWASISARIRDFRKARFGAHAVDRRYIQRGLYEYRLVINRKDLFS